MFWHNRNMKCVLTLPRSFTCRYNRCFCLFQYFLHCSEVLAGLLQNHRIKVLTNPAQTCFHFLFCLSWLARLRVMPGAAVWCTVHTDFVLLLIFPPFSCASEPSHCAGSLTGTPVRKVGKEEKALNNWYPSSLWPVLATFQASLSITCFTAELLWPTITANVFPASELLRCSVF